MADVPAFQIGDGPKLSRVPTALTNQPSKDKPKPQPWQNISLPEITSISASEGDVTLAIETRLRDHAVRHPENEQTRFWPPKLFDYLFDKAIVFQVVDALVSNKTLPANNGGVHRSTDEAKTYWTERIWGSGTQGSSFRRLFALLLLTGKEHCIKSLIHEYIDDSSIPLDENNPTFRGWRGFEIDVYLTYQKGFKVPFFASPNKLGDACHVVLDKNDIEPWYRTFDNQRRSSSAQDSNSMTSTTAQLQTMSLGGGYGEVYQIIIHPWQHNFHEKLKSISAHENLFALKRLYDMDKKAFERETSMLKRFSGHRNIVTLLATITCKKGISKEEYHLLFPWAEGDLLSYWQRKGKPKKDHETFIWISDQVCGIIEAVDFIHNPGPNMVDKDGEKLYGRHGDIKPENILWFRRDGAEILVISDLGLSAVHRDVSRSNVPGLNIPATPNYRPPECDMAGAHGHVSRSFDVWTLGCMFLEFVVWILDGWEGRQRFRSERFSAYINGVDTDIYFNIQKVDGDANKYAFKIKDKVEEATQQFRYLHKHRDCTQYLHDLLDLIQSRMLIIESDTPPPPVKRIKALELRQQTRKLNEKCKGRQYCLLACPRDPTYEPHDPVIASLNKTALKSISDNDMGGRLENFSGKSRFASLRRKST
ncbi:kinase-like protein [Acephala macrosclerotiorum]|nr:kinase-like protein [Acephala macrosclerotiorum]